MSDLTQTELNFVGKCCSSCGASDSPLVEIDEKFWCRNCLNKFYFRCSHCRKYKLNQKRKVVRNSQGYGTHACDPCFTEFYVKCSHCKYGHKKSEIVWHESTPICKYCYGSMFVCLSCKRRLFKDHQCTDGICRSCWEEERRIINPDHQAKAPLEFLGQGPHFYGIELEVECDETLDRRASYAKRILQVFNGFAITKHDGSIINREGRNVGFEIVTIPASKDVQFEKWDCFFDNLPKGLRSYDTQTCGLHIHCSRQPLSQLTIAKMLLFVNEPKNTEFITTIAGRSQNRFCKIQKKVPGDYRRARDRYEALNLTNKGTVEFRIFRGTLKRESLKKSIEFCDALIHFCKECGHSISDCRRVDKFVEYVKLHKKCWLHLWAFICARWLKEETDLTKKMGFPLPDKPAEVEVYNNEPNPEVRPLTAFDELDEPDYIDEDNQNYN